MCVIPFGAKVEAMMPRADATNGSPRASVDPEARIPVQHPFRKTREVVTAALASLDPGFDALRPDFRRPSIPPEQLIRASLIQILFSLRSERQRMVQKRYSLLFR